ncbi:plasmid mobilization relaxosome protein MobC [Methanobrevibacter arboriphilus]|uniref:Uncharacterized protein n=1 Tax=Methanobrevibacter arboriphilus TaxID=39441 RepID=A0ACA8R5M9_METAZ|nr:plasmid mobilization relaxosome protein MobC [Methanobrevibacter arboriphilus]BBL62641.1 hypothetical protein MarbSA_16810 [Methanobrevibacter arboriphilus]
MSKNNEYIKEITRENILEELKTSYNTLKNKLINGRIKDNEKEKIRIQQYKVLNQIAKTMNDILKQKELDEMQEEIKEIKEAIQKPLPNYLIEREQKELDEMMKYFEN